MTNAKPSPTTAVWAELAVILPVYSGTDLGKLRRALSSIYAQSLLPGRIIIAVDGPTLHDLDTFIELMDDSHQVPTSIIRFDSNRGPGPTFNDAARIIDSELIARMDDDDISLPYRFQRQFEAWQNDRGCSFWGGQIREFCEGNQPSRSRIVPCSMSGIKHYGNYRSPFNNVTMIMNRKAFLELGGYADLRFGEDYLLWLNVMRSKATYKNIPDFLVDVDSGHGFIDRRSGLALLKRELSFLILAFKRSLLPLRFIFLQFLMRATLRLFPAYLVGFFYNLARSGSSSSALSRFD